MALVGRPNVGKSTLFNCLVGRRQAIVSLTRGTTRDRITGTLEWRGTRLTLMDTGGLEVAQCEGMAAAVQAHVRRALQEADGFVFVCDATEGPVPADAMIVERLRETGKPVVVAVNKSDHQLVVPPDFFSLGLRQVCAVSALHGRGIGELLDGMVAALSIVPGRPPDGSSEAVPAVAIVGRQNVGKSSLVNALLKEERVLVTDVPGTTRDAVDTLLTVNGASVRLIDTAGLRHRRKVRDPIDHFAMSRTVEAIRRCDVALVVLDATQGITRDDQRILSQVCAAGCGCVLVVNKWDLMSGGDGPRARPPAGHALARAIHSAAPSAAFAPVLAISAKTGWHVPESLEAALRVSRAMQRRIAEAECLTLLQQAWRAQAPPRFRGRVIRLTRARWRPGRPARLELALGPVGWLPKPYQQYLLKRLFAHPGLSGVPVTLVLNGPPRWK
jgi:GTP-binding protein